MFFCTPNDLIVLHKVMLQEAWCISLPMSVKQQQDVLRRNPLENRVIVLTSEQKSHHALRAKLRLLLGVLIWLRDEGFFVKTKEKVEMQKQLKKNIGQSKLSNHKLRLVDIFQKRMNLADVAIKQQPSKFNRSVGSRKRLSPGMISFAARTFAWKKKLAEQIEVRIPSFIQFCDRSVLACLFRDYEVCDNWDRKSVV